MSKNSKKNTKIVVIINFARSGGTLLARVLGMLPNVILASEINPLLGVSPAHQAINPAEALKQQMREWYSITLCGDSFLEVVSNLTQHCSRLNMNLIIRDWTFLDFRKNKLNQWNCSYQFKNIESLGKVSDLVVFAFVRDAIDVYLSHGGDINDFSEDYLLYVKKLVSLKIPIVKYENLASNPNDTVKIICGMTGIEFSTTYQNYFTNFKCTGDTQSGNVSRGVRNNNISLLPRKWLTKKKRMIVNSCDNLMQANQLLGYPVSYDNRNIETYCQMINRKIRNRYYALRR